MNTKPCEFSTKKGVHLAHLNIRSLWNKYDTVRQLVTTSDLNVLSFSETWLNTNIDTNMINIPGYSCTRHDRIWYENNHVKKGGGLCCYVKNSHQTSSHDLEPFNMSTKDIELLWTGLKIRNSKKIIIGNIYRPPQGNVKTFCDTLDEKLIALRNSQRHNFEFYIMGDFNINYRTPNNPDTILLKWFEQKASLK